MPAPATLESWFQPLTSLLARPAFRRLWFYSCAGSFTLWTEIIITGWVALQLTGSPWLVALTGVGRSAAVPLIGPFGGTLADRVDRVFLVRIAEGGNLLTLALLTGAFLTGHGSYMLVLLSTIWFGISWALALPAHQALLMDLVGPKDLLPAVALDRVTQSVTRIVGPLLAGVLLTFLGTASYTGLVLLPALSLIVLQNLDVKRGDDSTSISVWRQLRQGLTYVRKEPIIWTVLLMNVAMNCFIYPSKHLYAVFAKNVLQAGPVALGFMGATDGLGVPLMLLLLPRLRGARTQGLTLAIGGILGSLVLAAFAFSTSLPVALALLVISGFGQAGFDVMRSTLILRHAKPSLRGRAMGLLVLSTGTFPIGALGIGAVAEHWGTPLAIGSGTLVCAAVLTTIVWNSPWLLYFRANHRSS